MAAVDENGLVQALLKDPRAKPPSDPSIEVSSIVQSSSSWGLPS